MQEDAPDQAPLRASPVLALHESHPGAVDGGGRLFNDSLNRSPEKMIREFAVKSPVQCSLVSEILPAIWQERKKLLPDDLLLWANKPLKQFMRVNSARRTHSF